MIQRKVKIVNELGLHARAAAVFVKTAQGFAAEIKVARKNVLANGKNIMSVMLLAASRNSMIDLQVDGEDEEEAMAALVQLIHNRFGEDR